MKTTNKKPTNTKVKASAKSARLASAKARDKAATDEAFAKDWLTQELGRRPTMEERFERIRLASKRLGITPDPPEPPLTEEELAEIAASTRRLRAMKKGPRVKQDSVEMLREMRGPGY